MWLGVLWATIADHRERSQSRACSKLSSETRADVYGWHKLKAKAPWSSCRWDSAQKLQRDLIVHFTYLHPLPCKSLWEVVEIFLTPAYLGANSDFFQEHLGGRLNSYRDHLAASSEGFLNCLSRSSSTGGWNLKSHLPY